MYRMQATPPLPLNLQLQTVCNNLGVLIMDAIYAILAACQDNARAVAALLDAGMLMQRLEVCSLPSASTETVGQAGGLPCQMHQFNSLDACVPVHLCACLVPEQPAVAAANRALLLLLVQAVAIAAMELQALRTLASEAAALVSSRMDSRLRVRLGSAAAALLCALPGEQPAQLELTHQQWLTLLRTCAPRAEAVAALLRQHWAAQASDPAVLAAARLELARAAATRDCANLRCPHFGRRGKKCTGCRAVRYCCQECNVAGWRAGHKHLCAALAAERQA